MTSELFDAYAHRYDVHTPAHHYADDHRWILGLVDAHGAGARVLDVGCGTGLLIERLARGGHDVYGIDASPGMVRVAGSRVEPTRLRCLRMQELDDREAYDVLTATSWSFHYVADIAEASMVLARMWRALRPGGLLVLQLAHAPHATGVLRCDHEVGPTGVTDDVMMLYRFRAGGDAEVIADYVYACLSEDELAAETHTLRVADMRMVAGLCEGAGFRDVRVRESWDDEVFRSSVCPWLIARR
jgi:SAM-dependent methyltransferase